MSSFEDLRADLVSRWKAAWDRIGDIDAPLPPGVKTSYTESPAFDLHDYSTTSWKAGARLLASPKSDRSYELVLDAKGRPLRVRHRHPVNGVSWVGVYRYAADEIEHIEWCVETGAPNLYNRLHLDADGAVLEEQRLVVNSAGSKRTWIGAPRGDLIAAIVAAPQDHPIYLWRYEVEGGVPRSGEHYQHWSTGVQQAALEYTYAADGSLQRIVEHWPSGDRTTFQAKPKRKT